jgi:hypothetical protein
MKEKQNKFAIAILVAILAPPLSFASDGPVGIAPHPAMSAASPAPTGSEDGPISLCKLNVDDAHATLRVVAQNDVLVSEGKEFNHATLVLHRRSKGLGVVTSAEIGTIWIENRILYLKWTKREGAKDAADQLKYAVVLVRGQDGRDLAVCHFIEPQAASFKLQGIESIKLTAPREIARHLKVQLSAIPDVWASKSDADARSVSLRQKGVTLTFDIAEEGAVRSHTVGAAPVATDDPRRRMILLDREIGVDEEQLNRLTATYTSAKSDEERASARRAIRLVETKMAQEKESRDLLKDDAARAAPAEPRWFDLREITLRVVLPNGVCVAQIALRPELRVAPTPAAPRESSAQTPVLDSDTSSPPKRIIPVLQPRH